MMGFAVWISGRAAAGVWVVPLAFAGSLHPALEALFGSSNLYSIILPPTGFAGWLFQTAGRRSTLLQHHVSSYPVSAVAIGAPADTANIDPSFAGHSCWI